MKRVYCKNCKYKVKYGLGCWHPLIGDGDWNEEINREYCSLYKRKGWWKAHQWKKKKYKGEK